MGNANGREEASSSSSSKDHPSGRSNGQLGVGESSITNSSSSPPQPSLPPLLFASQIPMTPLQRADGSRFFNQMWQQSQSECNAAAANTMASPPPEQGIPTVITWNYGGNEVAVQGSWDKWTSRKMLQRSGKDHSILLVLPSGLYHYKFIVDGEWRYIPDLPFEADEVTGVCNLLDVHNYVPENFEGVAEFEAPQSPELSYSQVIPSEEEFAKEPATAPPQVVEQNLPKSDEASCSKPQHVVLNHVFVDQEYKTQPVLALGLTHRFQAKYVTVLLYKPFKKAALNTP